ncbi:ComEC/Rec2 family competence protein [Flavobacterium sp.]|uniref:ComEC/Rec2 family competence protein n=1 Tax=Flavobacterium sp. TaxID=239 RepID=UPI00286DA2EF|nr:ComEC/Rec2 family competence protein [Flavobacterium sp.]
MKLLNFPLVRITFWFVFGIIIAHYANPNLQLGFGFLGITVFFFCFVYFKIAAQKLIFAISLYILSFAIGITTTLIHNDTLRENHYTNQSSNFKSNHFIKVIILEKLKNTTNNRRYFVKVIDIDDKVASGKILLNIKKESLKYDFLIGTKILIHDQIIKNFKPNNPDQFDYGKYLETKGIHAQVFTEASQIKISSEIDKNIWYYTSYFRNTIIENLSKSGFKKEELAVVSALILGQQQEISAEILRDYQYAGAVHILSVSGLHIGFILLFITFLLKPLPKNKLGNSIRLCIIVSSLWLFAIVAGLAPSVVRSATMFSFLAVGMFLNRGTNTFHTMVVSLFLILLVEPLFLFDIGFQLSYIALFFILWLQPMLKTLWKPKNTILIYFWDILTVSFAAQIGAMPLSIYYFHQFPGLFFVTNLVLIPILSVIMVLGVLVMLLAFFNIAPVFISKTLELSIALMNSFIKGVASLESFVIANIPLSFSLLVVCYFIVFSWVIWFRKPNFTKLVFAITTIFLFQIVFISNQWKEKNKKEWIVFNIKKKTIIADRENSKVTLYSNDTLVKNSFEDKMIQSYLTANFCELNAIKSLGNVLFFDRNKILIIDKATMCNIAVKPDVLILKNSPKLNLERLLTELKPKIIIADASNYKTYVAVWKATCSNKKILFHSTYEKGFYRIETTF